MTSTRCLTGPQVRLISKSCASASCSKPVKAIDHYGMIEPGTRWRVCLSGGKDSYTILAVLHELKWRGLFPVDLLVCNLDQGQPRFPATVLPEFLKTRGGTLRIEYQDTYSIVMDKVPAGRTMCALYSRLRRGNLYRIAREEGCSAVVLGHHRDDIPKTFFKNLFHGGRLATMPPKLINEQGDLCGSQDGLQRQQVKKLLDE